MDDRVTSQAAVTTGSPGLGVVWNVPNILTVARLVLSVFCFVCLAFDWYLPSLILFVIAAGTDWVDGFYARRYGQITKLGRILDPFADKIIICGTFIFLAAIPPTITGKSASEITAWMAVVVVAREILVTALRSFFEEHGTDFSAKWSGKWKMVLQCAAAAMSLWRLWYYDYDPSSPPQWTTQPAQWSTWMLIALVWGAVLLTIYSGWVYVQNALRLLKR
jgi:CDP-diacylglycerol--glycerol-3-phosphate 3-phosphatidyltransferase